MTKSVSSSADEVQLSKRFRPRVRIGFKMSRSDMERLSGKSVTIPDQSFTVRELFDRMARGLPMSVAREPQYGVADASFDDADLQHVSRFDPVDQIEFARARVETARGKVADAKRKLAADQAQPGEKEPSHKVRRPKRSGGKEASRRGDVPGDVARSAVPPGRA